MIVDQLDDHRDRVGVESVCGDHDAREMHLYLEERFTFRAVELRRACARAGSRTHRACPS
ncbi:hypothetical protein XF36_04990 [Pseudonocardia sp. HH130629-09]|nr:hypothetical protein XF36_04990 [Pseudonocardia sp. HH130629-09]